jgi:hypothetical protein
MCPLPKDPEKAEIWRKRQAEAQRGKSRNAGENNPFYGKKHSEEQKLKWSRERRGKKRQSGKRIVQTPSLPEQLKEDALRKYYLDEELSVASIAEKLNSSIWYVRRALGVFGIPKRTRSEVQSITNRRRIPKRKKRITTNEGYIMLNMPDHPRASRGSKTYVFEHIVVWEKANHQLLPDDWIVHHINGIKDDNRIKNLMALPRKNHHSWLVLQDAQKHIVELEEEIKRLNRRIEELTDGTDKN